MGDMYCYGWGVALDKAQALRWYQLAGAQGHPDALFKIAFCHECGWGVPQNNAETMHWYRCAHAAGHSDAAVKFKRFYPQRK